MIAALLLLLLQEEPSLSKERVVLRTSMGDIVLVLYPEAAPKHVEQILKLVKAGVYDSTYFHRVESTFLIQLTDAANRENPLTRDQKALLTKIPAEFNVKHKRGRLTMAHGDDPNGAESSFSILVTDAPHLDGQYTVFGRVENTMDVVDAIAGVEVNLEHQPIQRVRVTRAMVVESRDELDKMTLRGVIPQVARPFVAAAQPWVLWTVVAMIASGLATAVAAFLGALRWAQALALATVLIGGFLLFAALTPKAARFGMPGLGVALFIGLIALIRVMGAFEKPPANRP